jgi:SAM-dependent methyltransferase
MMPGMLEGVRSRAPVMARLRARVVDRRDLLATAEALRDVVALEPGGPSAIFGPRGLVPVYPRLAALDTLDYAERTLWSDQADGGVSPRRRLIAEAGRLEGVSDGVYDAVLASHVLEHVANPLGALAEWRRVVRPGGHVLLVMPHRDGTFDHRRPLTTVEHMREDAARETAEDDVTHLEEILALHDLERDPGAPNREVFERRCRKNVSSRAMHHHVFVARTVVEMCWEAKLEVLLVRAKLPFNIVCMCRVGDSGDRSRGERELSELRRRSPFLSDRE